jgi:hypothetical protein
MVNVEQIEGLPQHYYARPENSLPPSASTGLRAAEQQMATSLWFIVAAARLVQSFFGKLAKTLSRGIRVHSKKELRAHLELYLPEVNQEPVVFKWKYKLQMLPTESVVP